MAKKYQYALFILLCLVVAVLFGIFLFNSDIPVLEPKGWIADQQRNLLVIATLLMLIVVIPVFVLTIVFAWRYRASNEKTNYMPNWHDNFIAECIWWGIPCLIILVLAVLTWKACYKLDPFRPIDSDKKPLTIQVIALQWKWLFLYPEQNIATVNFIRFPEKTPLNFEITADAPMNSFWIPDLGGQIFAMPQMITKLHLIANGPGVFRGVSANISGRGFSGMMFTAQATSQADFDQWVQSAQQSSYALTPAEYHVLAQPSEYDPEKTYVLQEAGLFQRIANQYMMPTSSMTDMNTTEMDTRSPMQ